VKYFFIAAGIFLSVLSCNPKPSERFTTKSAEINVLKKGLTHYENADWVSWAGQYADSAKIFQNSWSEYETPAEVKNRYVELISKLSDYSFDKEEMFMEQVIDDQGRTWVNFWGLWRGILKANNKTIEIPVHLNFQFDEGKIIREYGYWDTAQLYEELKKVEHNVAEKID
jgi:hypothetical protein